MAVINSSYSFGGAVAQLGARLDGIEEVVGSNPIGSTNFGFSFQLLTTISRGLLSPEPEVVENNHSLLGSRSRHRYAITEGHKASEEALEITA